MLLLDNPEFQRQVRSKLRPRSLMLLGVTAVLVFGTTVAATYFIDRERSAQIGSPFTHAGVMHSIFFAITGVQLAIVALYGVGLSSQNIALEKERGTFEFQRLVAMGPWHLTVGKLFGAPAEAFFTALFGIPFALFSGIGG